jgi:uncharacterized protein (TIGR02145 family)
MKMKSIMTGQNTRLIYVAIFFLLTGLTRLTAQTVMDADSNVYATVKIGDQIWMAENLKTTKFSDGKKIPLVVDDAVWKSLTEPAYCFYNNDKRNKELYGALYNWYAVDTKKICPKGWHVPTKLEWSYMISTVGDENNSGVKLKEKGLGHWKNFHNSGTDDLDFTALPGGMRLRSGIFPVFGNSYTVWWTASDYSETDAWCRGLDDNSIKIYGGHDGKQSGFSVRCIMD